MSGKPPTVLLSHKRWRQCPGCAGQALVDYAAECEDVIRDNDAGGVMHTWPPCKWFKRSTAAEIAAKLESN